MAFTDPQSVTIATVANSLPKIGTGPSSGTYQKDDGNVKLSINHAFNKRNRSAVRLDHTKIAADPLGPATNVVYTMAVTLVADHPKVGYSITEKQQIAAALIAWATPANILKMLGGES